MKKIALFIFLSWLSLSLFAQKKPNIVFILADDMGYGDLGCYGQQFIRTPNLDRLAESGIRFTQFYAGTSVCAPSRAALLTGLHTGHTPVRGNLEIQPEGQYPLPDSIVTMAEMLKKAGYTTGLFGKWGLGYPHSEGDPTNQGFDRFFGYNCQRQSHNFFPGHLWDNTQRVECNNTPANQVQYAPDLIQAQALTFVADNKNKPFFLYLAYTLPHAGLQLPAGDTVFENYKKSFNEQPVAIPATWNGAGYQPQAYPMAAYAAMVTGLDAYVGQVIKKLKELGIEENTLIVFTSDNGPHREGGNRPELFNSSGGFRGVKRDLYEGGIREPMIVSWPAVISPGRQSHYVGAFWDFFPTFAQIAGQPRPAKTDGLSILTELNGKPKQKEHSFLYWEFHEDGGRQAVRIGNWKGVRLNALKGKNEPIQLFDLAADPKETKDVSAQHPAIVRKIHKIMAEQHTEVAAFPFWSGAPAKQ
jgi:arylsulfatase A-like enzyme